jgi:hypothetical protein
LEPEFIEFEELDLELDSQFYLCETGTGTRTEIFELFFFKRLKWEANWRLTDN